MAVLGLAAGMGLGALLLRYNGALTLPRPGSGNLAQGASGPVVGQTAPDFTLVSTDGGTIRLSGLQGSPVLINFWASWCAPCRLEMPAIQERYEQHSPALKVLAINLEENDSQVEGFMQELNLDFPALLDPDGYVNHDLFRVRGYPTSVFIDKLGAVQAIHIGIMTEDQLDGYLEQVGLE
jgi:thiol-disulfide isomerase/thioredoxin